MIQMFSLYYFKIKSLEVNILELLLKESKISQDIQEIKLMKYKKYESKLIQLKSNPVVYEVKDSYVQELLSMQNNTN